MLLYRLDIQVTNKNEIELADDVFLVALNVYAETLRQALDKGFILCGSLFKGSECNIFSVEEVEDEEGEE